MAMALTHLHACMHGRELTRRWEGEAGVVFWRTRDGAHWRQENGRGAWVPARRGSRGSRQARPVRMFTWVKATRLVLVDGAQLVQAGRTGRARDVAPLLATAFRAVPAWRSSVPAVRHGHGPCGERREGAAMRCIRPPWCWAEAGGRGRLHHAAGCVELCHGHEARLERQTIVGGG